ncbi:MAG: carboxypeptidase regulatory-like domain-containing protein [bacterium]
MVQLALLAAGVLAASAVPRPVAAQQQVATLVGLVRDSSGHPVPNAEVRLTGSQSFTYTNDSGGFRLLGLPLGTVNVTARRLGFAPASFDLRMRAGQRDSLVLTLTILAQSLPGMVAEDEAMARSQRLLAGFWSRRSQGFGHYLTRDEIVKRDAHEFTDLVRMVPSVSVQLKNGRPTIRFPRYGQSSMRGDCPPLYWVDGQRVENASPDEFPPNDMEAIEIYSGAATIPPQFAPRMTSNTCGVIVIWTRIPGQ